MSEKDWTGVEEKDWIEMDRIAARRELITAALAVIVVAGFMLALALLGGK